MHHKSLFFLPILVRRTRVHIKTQEFIQQFNSWIPIPISLCPPEPGRGVWKRGFPGRVIRGGGWRGVEGVGGLWEPAVTASGAR